MDISDEFEGSTFKESLIQRIMKSFEFVITSALSDMRMEV